MIYTLPTIRLYHAPFLLHRCIFYAQKGGLDIAKKRSDGRYAKQVVLGYRNGKPVRKTIYGKTLKELDKKYRDFMNDKESGRLIKNDKIKVKELLELWFTNTKVCELKPQSLGNLKSQIKGVNYYIGDKLAKDIQRSDIEQIRAELIEEDHIDKYNKALGIIRAVFNYAIECGFVLNNPTLGMKRISIKRNTRALTDEERLLFEKTDLNEFERCFTSLLLYSGLRRSEALALSDSDIHFDEGYINVNKTLVLSKASTSPEIIQDMPKSDSGIRKIPISHYLYPILFNYCQNRTGLLFLSEEGNPLGSSTFRKRWQSMLQKLEAVNGKPIAEDITPHIFRHTYTSDLVKAGMDIKTAQYLLGHADAKTTLNVYTHFGYNDIKINKLDDYYKTLAVKMQSRQKNPGTA